MTDKIDADWLAGMPKAELHIHLEGSIPTATLLNLAGKYDVDLPRPAERLYEFDGLKSFLAFLDWICGLIRSDDDLEGIAYEFARTMSEQRVAYAEVIVNPSHWRKHWTVDRLAASIVSGFERAAGEGLADCRLLLSILRTQSGEDAETLVDWMIANRNPRIVGLSIDGNEQAAGRTGTRFAQAFAKAKAAGIATTAHAGESSGPEGVRDALDLLRVNRIDHGVRAAEDPELLARLAREGIALNVCLTSNLVLLYPSIDLHPLRKLLEAGVRVTVNTDDPALLDVTQGSEWAKVASLCEWTRRDAAAAARRAIDAAFCDEGRKRELHLELDSYLY
ncbi:adenosine deaminase [Cohnella cholangitidis]|nr:adenosine deaminase [Cohnella cholangitidis]